MDTADQLRAMVAYNCWANDKILVQAAKLTEEERRDVRDEQSGSVFGQMSHVLVAQRVWLARIRGDAVDSEMREVHALDPEFAVSHAEMTAFAAQLSAEDCARTIAYTDSSGVAWERPLWQLITQAVNHGTHHRAETGRLLAILDHSPGDMDFVIFAAERL